MSYVNRGDDWTNYEHFADTHNVDSDDPDVQDAYFTFIFEYEGVPSESVPGSIEAFFDFLDAFEIEYDYEDMYERYVED